MAITAADRQHVIEKYKRGDGDTGSPEVQVALLTLPHQPSDRPFQGAHA